MLDRTQDDIQTLRQRLDVAEARLRRQTRLMGLCLAGLAIVVLAVFLPGVAAVMGLVLFVGAVAVAVLMLISVMMGLLEWVSPSGRIPPPGDSGGSTMMS